MHGQRARIHAGTYIWVSLSMCVYVYVYYDHSRPMYVSLVDCEVVAKFGSGLVDHANLSLSIMLRQSLDGVIQEQ